MITSLASNASSSSSFWTVILSSEILRKFLKKITYDQCRRKTILSLSYLFESASWAFSEIRDFFSNIKDFYKNCTIVQFAVIIEALATLFFSFCFSLPLPFFIFFIFFCSSFKITFLSPLLRHSFLLHTKKNNFQNNILNYERILEDIKEFHGEIEFSQEEYKFTKMDRNWRHVYEGLPWPLAITYLSATRGGFENVQKANAYFSK